MVGSCTSRFPLIQQRDNLDSCYKQCELKGTLVPLLCLSVVVARQGQTCLLPQKPGEHRGIGGRVQGTVSCCTDECNAKGILRHITHEEMKNYRRHKIYIKKRVIKYFYNSGVVTIKYINLRKRKGHHPTTFSGQQCKKKKFFFQFLGLQFNCRQTCVRLGVSPPQIIILSAGKWGR